MLTIIALVVTAALAIVGWTVTATLGSRMRSWEKLEKSLVAVESALSSTTTRVAVLENKYDTIQATLLEIKVLLQRHLDNR
jgi:uncharacterized protein YoxC